MISRAATIDAGGRPAAEAVELAPVRGGAMKFLYASGSRPLEGYAIKRGIGRGGFGEVYFATSDAGKEVALKHIERNLEVELRGVGQCLNLKHPNLIDLYDIRYDEQGDAWVVMEYVAGASLKDMIDRNPNGLPLDQVNFWFRGIAAGTAYLHDHGIVHRDLKPGNIFEDAGFVKIGDYGLSKFISTQPAQRPDRERRHVPLHGPRDRQRGLWQGDRHLRPGHHALRDAHRPRAVRRREQPGNHHEAPDGRPGPVRRAAALSRDHPAGLAKGSREAVPQRQRHVGHADAPHLSRDQTWSRCVARTGSEPVYIGDDSDGIQFGPLQVHAASAAVAAEVVKVIGHAIPTTKPPFDEPIAQAVHGGARRFADWWKHGSTTTPLKIVVLVAVALMAIYNGGWLVPTAVVLGSVYLVYIGFRMLIGAMSAQPVCGNCACRSARRPRSPQSWLVRSSQRANLGTTRAANAL